MKPTQEQVIAWAREAGAGEPESLYGRTDYVVMTKYELQTAFTIAYEAGRRDENEACAALARHIDPDDHLAAIIASAIRARREQ